MVDSRQRENRIYSIASLPEKDKPDSQKLRIEEVI